MVTRAKRNWIPLCEKRKNRKTLATDGGRKSQSNNIRKYEETGTRSAAPRLAIGEAILFTIQSAQKEKKRDLDF